ncbi:MAG: ATP-binding protein [Chloroflexi bacterium]|nr:ATP-binding protein [Chloroflexota bacterium]
MTDSSTAWHDANQQYLAAALQWLRLKLNAKADIYRKDDSPPRGCLFGWRRPALPLRRTDQRDIQRAEETMNAAAGGEHVPALVMLALRFGLTDFERATLLLCAAPELDTSMARLCAQAQDDPQRTYPTFALALALLDDPAWDVVSPEQSLRFWRLIEILQPGTQPLTVSPLRADETIVNAIKGLNHIDARLTLVLDPLEPLRDIGELPPSQLDTLEQVRFHIRNGAGRQPVIQLVGPDSHSKQLIAGGVALLEERRLYRLPAGLLPRQSQDLELLARLWERESRLSNVALYVDAREVDVSNPADELAQHLKRLLFLVEGLVLLDTRIVWPGLGAPSVTIDVNRPTPVEQRAAWEIMVGATAPDSPAQLAGQFNLNLDTIAGIAISAAARQAESGGYLDDLLWDTCLGHTRPQLDTLAQRIDVKAGWDDIILPKEQKAILSQIADQVAQRTRVYDEWGFRAKMNRGLSISALFAGDSGTGKTMAAEVIANELQLNLYRIDLSAVVSKYIGETEKNLRRLFDAAEDGGAILFFDEADALFGKRTEVKDSHDRYANIEINYLLQRIESFQGLAILATNMKGALDAAFIRRLRFVVNFPFPDVEQRKAIWQSVFPQRTPLADESFPGEEQINFERLARFSLTGGNIHNAAVNAAFLAAHHGQVVTMPVIMTAIRSELLKLERPINEADFPAIIDSNNGAQR